MPAFVTNGPDIPERLLQAHEEGRVVFFCGAGISYPAGLPDFRGLVDQIYAELSTTRTPIENQAYENKQYDAALGLLERRYPGQRLAVRTALAIILTPKWRKKEAATTHQALLQLATDRKGKIRLVTTNFDRIFERVITRHKLGIPSFAAPLLPIPKPTRWHGVIYLHGLLSDPPDESALNRLVLTSGDFGLAYLTERWAARFVSDLFRNYTICFVGYSINDPVLRYMMDALAVDELLGETRPEAYAFASFLGGGQDQVMIEWEAKGVTPLLYEVPEGTKDHSSLHITLKEWADTYRDGAHGKQMIIAKHASTPPLAPLRSDFAVGRVLWALTDGLAAKYFADLNPVPPLEWLQPLTEDQFRHEDLSRFGVTPKTQKDDELSFSFIRRPAPYTHAPRMCLTNMGARGSDWDEVMFHLARWLLRHLDNPKLVVWLAKQGGQLHERFSRLIRSRIKELDRLEHEGKQEELKRILEAAPNAIPGPLMSTLWRFFLSGHVKSHAQKFDLYDWLLRFKQDGLTPTLRMILREILTPCVMLREPIRWSEEPVKPHEPKHIKELVDWELVLSNNHVHYVLRDLEKNARWQASLPDLLQDFTVLLRDALDLMRELGGADDKSDGSYIDQPSISKHLQNSNFHDWTALIDLTRDAWLLSVKANPTMARLVVESWWHIPYPLFKRLAFFAAANSDVITPWQALDWMLADGHWWLWSVETQREAIRLLVALAPKLNASEMAELEQAILGGPPREMFKNDIDFERWRRIVDREVWLRLVKLEATGTTLDRVVKATLDELSQRYPDWQIAPDEHDEFPYWMSEGNEWRNYVTSPRRRRELMEWLTQPSTDHWQEDDWRQRCRDNFSTTACALCALAKEDKWPTERWHEALQSWAEDKLLKRSWRYMARVIESSPDEMLQSLAPNISWWLQAQAKTFNRQEGLFLSLIRRLLAMQYNDIEKADDDPVNHAINHPVGHATEALLRWWYRQELKDGQGLKDDVRPLFTQLCDGGVDKFRHGRIILAAHTIALFRVDEQWAKMHLLPLFDWQRSEIEARAAWEGFLWSPRFYRPLLTAIKPHLLETARHYGQLCKHAEQYADFLTFVALDPGDTFSVNELAEATQTLPAAGLQSAAQAVTRALEGAGEQRGEYWRNRVHPYLKSVWPKSRAVMTPAISERLSQLCVATRETFPDALGMLRHWLQPVEYPDYLVRLLNEAGLCKQFPSDALTLLDAVIGNEAVLLLSELKQSLDDIGNSDQTLVNDTRFVRLTELCGRRGIS